MNYMDYWSEVTNPQTGAMFERFLSFMENIQNGKMNVGVLLASDYGKELTRMLELRFRLEGKNPMGPEHLDYYRSIGIRKQMFETEDYFTRWALFTSLDLEEDRKYPLIIWNHGGSNQIETEEFNTHLIPMTATEKYMVLMAQNTNWDNLERLIDVVGESFPLDRERVYVCGFSQGGRIAATAMLRMPEKLAGVALMGGPVFDTRDNHDIPFTIEEMEHATQTFVPYLQIMNQCETSNFVPLNNYKPRSEAKKINRRSDINPLFDTRRDPTRPRNGLMTERIRPPKSYDSRRWMIDRLNLRMTILGCELRDPDKCIAFIDKPEDDLHHVMGFYGDRERIETYYECKHYMIDIYNKDGIDAFRYVVVANTNHWLPVTAGEMLWNFFRQFRRDKATGKIMVDNI